MVVRVYVMMEHGDGYKSPTHMIRFAEAVTAMVPPLRRRSEGEYMVMVANNKFWFLYLVTLARFIGSGLCPSKCMKSTNGHEMNRN